MNRLLLLVLPTVAAMSVAALAQPAPSAPPAKPAPPEAAPAKTPEAEEWVKQMRADALKMIAEGDAALAKGDERLALDRYLAAHEIYKVSLAPNELKKLAEDIIRLRTKLGVPDHTQPVTPPKAAVDLNDPAIASRRTEALQKLSEAEQYLEEGRFYEAGQLLTRLYARFRDTLQTEEDARVTQGLMTARERLGLTPLPADNSDVLPYVVRSGDEEIDSLCLIHAGTFTTDAAAATESAPALMFSSAAVRVEGLTNAVYFEVRRSDDPANPFRQGIITFYRLDSQLRMRVLDIPTASTRTSVVGLWAAPDVFPPMNAATLSINTDMALTRNDDGSGYVARTSGRVPTMTGGALMMTSQFKTSADGLTIDDRGYDAAGKEVWRSGSETGVTFKRAAAPAVVRRTDGGVVVIDLIPGEQGEAVSLTRGGEVAMHFSYWGASTGAMVATSRVADRPPQRVRFPVGFIKGLDEGMEGITRGTRRRVVIPPALAWGEQGNNWQVPPNSSVIFDVEALWVQGPTTPPAIAPPGPPGEAGPQPRPSGGGH